MNFVQRFSFVDKLQQNALIDNIVSHNFETQVVHFQLVFILVQQVAQYCNDTCYNIFMSCLAYMHGATIQMITVVYLCPYSTHVTIEM